MEKKNNSAVRFREVRALLGLTQQALADELLLSRNYIAKIESGIQEPSDRARLALESLRVRLSNKTAPAFVDTAGVVAEPSAPYGGAGDTVEEIERHHQSLLLAAKGDPVRLGWIHEQQRAHLAIPAHWLSAQVKAPAATPKAQRRRTTSGLVPVSLPSQKILLSTHTGLPVASPSHGARSA